MSGPYSDHPPRPARPPLERGPGRRVIAGVCGALGRHLDIDPVVFRVVIAVLCVSGGIGLFIYGLAWLIIPIAGESGEPPRGDRDRNHDDQHNHHDHDHPRRHNRNELQRLLNGHVDAQSLGAVLTTLLGTAVLFTYMNQGNHFFALLLIGLLAVAALRYDPRRHLHRAGSFPPPAPSPEDAVPRDAPPKEPTAPTPPPAPPWWQRDTPTSPPPPPPPAPYQRERSFLGLVFFLLALFAGAAVWLTAYAQHRSANAIAVLAAVLLVLGLGLLAGARRGRARGLAVPALLLTLLLAAVSALPSDLRSTGRHEVWAPAGAAAVQSTYQLGAGRGDLDLSAVDPHGRTVAVTARVGAGLLDVRLPADAEVRLSAHAGIGSVLLPDGSRRGGFGPGATLDLPPAGPSHGTLALTLEVGAGRLEVTR